MKAEKPMAGLFDKAHLVADSGRDRERLSRQLKEDVSAFLAAGGQITVVPPGASAANDYRPQPKTRKAGGPRKAIEC